MLGRYLVAERYWLVSLESSAGIFALIYLHSRARYRGYGFSCSQLHIIDMLCIALEMHKELECSCDMEIQEKVFNW